MRILVLAANREKFPDPVFPLGASYIAHAIAKSKDLKGEPYSLEIFDACFEEDLYPALKEKLLNFQPDVIGFSMRNVDNNAFPKAVGFLSYYVSLMEVIRANSKALVILGGSAFTIFPEYFMERLGAEYGIAGEGEYAFVDLLRKIEMGEAVKGVLTRSEEIKDINFDTFPSRKGFDVKRYYQNGGCINIQTKRGCAFRCSYCTYPFIEGHEYRLRDTKNIVDEIQYWYEREGIQHYFFVDSVFNHPEAYAMEIVNEIVRRQLTLNWTGFFAPIFTEEFAAACKSAGLSSMDLGTDAFSEKTLCGYRKFFSVEDVFRSCEICRKYGIKYNHSVIFGGPNETPETFEETVRNIDLTDPTSVIGFVGVRLYPNTPIIEDVGWGKVGIEPEFYVSPHVQEMLEERLREVTATRKNWIVPGLDRGVNMKLFERMRKKGIKGQLWEWMK